MAQKKLTVETLKYKDVRGKELLYLRIKDEATNVEALINVGERTYKSVQDIIEPPAPELPLPNRIENNQVTNTPQTQEELKTKVNNK